MKVIRPTTANQTSDPDKHGYNAYDFSGKGEQEITAKYNGKIIKYSDGEARNWLAFSANDPYKNTRNGKLLTQDYGNYILVEYEGGLRHLIAHFGVNTVRKTAFSKGDVLGVVGNTGNSTGKHSHHEYRQGNTNIKVEFVDDVIITPPVSNIDYKAIFDKTGDQLPDRALKDDSLFQTDKLYKDNNIPYVTLTADSVNHFMSEFRKFRDIANTPAVTPPDAPQTGDNFEAVTKPPLQVEPDLPANPATEFDIFDWLWGKITDISRTLWNKIKR